MKKTIIILSILAFIASSCKQANAQQYKTKDNDIIINNGEYIVKGVFNPSTETLYTNEKYSDIFYVFSEPFASQTKIDYTFQFQYSRKKVFQLLELKELILSPNIDEQIQWLIIHNQPLITEDIHYAQNDCENLSENKLHFTTNGKRVIVPYQPNICFVFYKDGTFIGSIENESNLENIKFMKQMKHKHFVSLEPITDIAKWNDIGYYLEQGYCYSMAIDILEKVLQKSPGRVVAYLNIADAYWGNNEKAKAKESYNKYIELMKSQEKDMNKIPTRVYDRIK